MFSQVARRFGSIPFKPRQHTKTLLQNCISCNDFLAQAGLVDRHHRVPITLGGQPKVKLHHICLLLIIRIIIEYNTSDYPLPVSLLWLAL